MKEPIPTFFNVRTIKKRGTLEKAKKHYPTRGVTLFLDPSPKIIVQNAGRRAISQANRGMHADPSKSSFYRLNKMIMPQLNKKVIQRVDDDSRTLKLAEIALLSKLVQNIGQADEKKAVVAREAEDDEAIYARLEAQRDIRNLRDENEELQGQLRQMRGAGAELRGRREEAEADLRSDESSQASSERQALVDRRRADRMVQEGQGMQGISELVALRARQRTERLGKGFQEVLSEQPQVRFRQGEQPSSEEFRQLFVPKAPPPPPPPPQLVGLEGLMEGRGKPRTPEPEAGADVPEEGGMVKKRRKEDLSEEQEQVVAQLEQTVKKRKTKTPLEQALITQKRHHTILKNKMDKDKKYWKENKGKMESWVEELESRKEVIRQLDKQHSDLPKTKAHKGEKISITAKLRGLRPQLSLLEQDIKQLSDFSQTYKEKKQKNKQLLEERTKALLALTQKLQEK